MITLLKNQAKQYFKQTSIPNKFQSISQDKQMRKFFTMLISQFINLPYQIIQTLQQISKLRSIPWSAFLQSIWAISLNLQSNTQQFNNITEVIKQVSVKNMVSKNTIMLQLPDSLINSACLMQQKDLDKKTNRANTKLNFEQNKFNLFSQNNQGYAKISLLLITLNTNTNSNLLYNTILSLIGNFDLDPDRVLDLILQGFIAKPNHPIFIPLIKKFNKKSLSPLIGHKLLKSTPQSVSQKLIYCGSVQNFLKSSMTQLYKQNGFIPNPNIIFITALLIKSQCLDIQDIFPYLQPSNEIIQKIQVKKILAGKHKVSKSFKMSLEQPSQSQKLKIESQDQITFTGQIIHSSKLALLAKLIQINDWENFNLILETFNSKIDVLIYQPLFINLCNLLQWVIDPVYSKISMARFFNNPRKTCKSFKVEEVKTKQIHQSNNVNEQFWYTINQLFEIIGPYIGFNSIIYIKICRLFKNIINELKDNKSQQEEIDFIRSKQMSENSIKRILKYYLLPGIIYQTQNPTLSIELFNLLELFDYRFRYQCYLHDYTVGITETPFASMIFQTIKNKQNVIVNNLSKDNKKTFIKKMAKLTHNQVLQVFYWIIRRLLMSDYEAVVPQIVSVLNNSTQLTLQMIMFVNIYTLVSQKLPAVNFKTNQTQPWFKNMITFISLFYRKYLDIDIQPVFDYILMKLGEETSQIQESNQMPGTLLKLLHQLINKMFGSFMIQDINKAKYDIISSGPRLQFQALYISSQIRAAKKSKVTLQNFFLNETLDYDNGNSLIFSLLVLMSQKKVQFLFRSSYISDLKIIGDVIDQFNMTFMQLVRFLKYQCIDYTYYLKVLPSHAISQLLNTYKLPIQNAFQIVRPSLKSIGSMNNQQWNCTVNQIKQAMEKYLLSEENFFAYQSQRQKLKQYLNRYREEIKNYLPINIFSFFWLSSLDAIYFPQKIYSDKIEELRKKIDSMKKTDRQYEKSKTLFEKLKKQEQQQRKKYQDMNTPQGLSRFQIELLKGSGLDKAQVTKNISQFSTIFVQVCLIPRMTMDATQALYCAKFTVEMIKANKLSSSRSIRMLTIFIQLVMNYLPYATERQSSHCLSIYLSQILGIFSNWHDPNKLKSDIKKNLNIEQTMAKDNYQKLKQYLLKLFERGGNLIKSIKEQPYIIKNCLYLLEKVQAIPGYKQQAEELQAHIKQLKQVHTTVDMQTILERQISFINAKKPLIMEKPQQKKKEQPQQSSQTPIKQIKDNKEKQSKQTKDTKQKPFQKHSVEKSSKFKDVTKDSKSNHGYNHFKGKTQIRDNKGADDSKSRHFKQDSKNYQHDNKKTSEKNKNARDSSEKSKNPIGLQQKPKQQKKKQEHSSEKNAQQQSSQNRTKTVKQVREQQMRFTENKKTQQSLNEISEKKTQQINQGKNQNQENKNQISQGKESDRVSVKVDNNTDTLKKESAPLGPYKQVMVQNQTQQPVIKVTLREPTKTEVNKPNAIQECQKKTDKEQKPSKQTMQNKKIQKQDSSAKQKESNKNQKSQNKTQKAQTKKDRVDNGKDSSKGNSRDNNYIRQKDKQADKKNKYFKDEKRDYYNNDQNQVKMRWRQNNRNKQSNSKDIRRQGNSRERQKRFRDQPNDKWDKRDHKTKRQKKEDRSSRDKKSNERKRSRSRDKYRR